MQVIGNPGVDHLDFELWCLAASAVTGCAACVASHDRVVRAKGATAAMVQDAVRIAAIVHALALTLEGAAALA
jgi:alkyl hydroperoxide reductase subunit D